MYCVDGSIVIEALCVENILKGNSQRLEEDLKVISIVKMFICTMKLESFAE